MHSARHFALLTVLFLAAPARCQELAQPEPAPVLVPGDGTQVFRSLLSYAKIKPVTEKELQQFIMKDDVIVIIIGNPRANFNARYWPQSYPASAVDFGGAALIATDTSYSHQSSSGHNLMISGARVTCNNPDWIHDGKTSCPYLIPLHAVRNSALDLFSGLNRIATNKPSFLSVDEYVGSFQYRVLTFPRDARVNDRFGLPPGAAFAIGGAGADNGSPRDFRFLAMADHSVFINQMLLEPNTDNLELAYRTIKFLQGPNNRSRCLFFENGVLIDHFDDLGQAVARQNPLPIPRINMGAMQEWMVTQGNRMLDVVQRDDVINRALNRGFGVPAIARFFLVIGSLLACWFLLRRLWISRKPGDTPPPPVVVVASTGPPGVFERRQKELLRRNNVYEPIRDLLREFFQSIGIHGEQGRRHPQLVISDVVRKADSLRAAVKDMWKLAYGPPQVLSVTEWGDLEPFFDRLRRAYADGKWYFVLPEATAGSVE